MTNRQGRGSQGDQATAALVSKARQWIPSWTPKVCEVMAFWAVFGGFVQFFCMLLASRCWFLVLSSGLIEHLVQSHSSNSVVGSRHTLIFKKGAGLLASNVANMAPPHSTLEQSDVSLIGNG